MQYQLFENHSEATRADYPYLLDVQVDTLRHLNSRVVIPLSAVERVGQVPARLCPTVEVEGEALVLLTTQIGAVPCARLSHPCGDLRHMREQIVSAIDFLVTGF